MLTILLIILLSVPFAVIYLIPTIICVTTNHQNKAAIIALNILGGWTFIEWVVALVWALTKSEGHTREVVYVKENKEPDHEQKE